MYTSDDADAILTQTINELPITNLFLVSADASVSDVGLQVLTHGERVVENEDHFPLGVIDRELATSLVGMQGSLSEYVESLVPIVICPRETKILTIMYTTHELGSIPWFVLQAGETYGGLVSPASIFNAFARYFQSRQEQRKTYWHNLHQNKNLTYPSLIDPVLPNPNPGPPTCYCCPLQLNSHKPHRLQRNELRKVDVRGNYLCPTHPAQRVVPSIGCTAC